MRHSIFCVLLLSSIFIMLNIPTTAMAGTLWLEGEIRIKGPVYIAQTSDMYSPEQLNYQLSHPLEKVGYLSKHSRRYQKIEPVKSQKYARWTVTYVEMDSLQKAEWDQLGIIYIAKNNPGNVVVAFDSAISHSRSMRDEIALAHINPAINTPGRAIDFYNKSWSIIKR